MSLECLKPKLKILKTSKGAPIVERIRGHELQRIRERVLIRDEFTCQRCKNSYIDEFLEVDHIYPLHLGGSENDENRQVICKDCHLEKTLQEERERGV